MVSIGWIDLLRAEAVACLACAAGFIIREMLRRRTAEPADRGDGAVFLFDGDTLIDASTDARSLLMALAAEGADVRGRLQSYLSNHIPDIAQHLETLEKAGRFSLVTSNGMTVQVELTGGITRIALDSDSPGQDAVTRAAQTEELARLRRIVHDAALPIWHETPEGDVIWANPAYMKHAQGDAPRWPLPKLFPQVDEVELPGGWLGVSRADRTGVAWPLDRARRAEVQLREFRQTLTRTFADLPIGLAIFDRQRLLQIFNPALLDLTGLPPDLLSARPSLFAILDALRDRSMIPEPKDYNSWRKQMMELEEAAARGRYEETWSLSGGQTWRVVGRPHPDGALALMFEDISTEMTRTRRYRADLELGQAVLDAMEEAVAVFTPSGTLVMSNAAYARLWGDDPGATLSEQGIATLVNRWRMASAPTQFWAEVETFTATLGPRVSGQGMVRLLDGRGVECRYNALAGGATLVGFRQQAGLTAMAKAS